MATKARQQLKDKFLNGARPTEDEFADIFDSCLNIADDQIQVDPAADHSLIIPRGLRLGDSTDKSAGTLRFNGTVPQFYDGTNFVDFGVGGGTGGFQAIGAGIAFNGAVGVGNFAAVPAYKLDVQLGATGTPADQARLGNAVIFRGTGAQNVTAHFGHENRANNTEYALRQRPDGEVAINAPATLPIFFNQGGNNTKMTISKNGNVLVGATAEINGVGHPFQVNGEAYKNTVSNIWQVSSDARLKEDIADYVPGLAEICDIRPVWFSYNGKAGTTKGARGVGVIGQEIEKVLPETIHTVRTHLDDEHGEVDDLRIYDGNALIYTLINAVKELSSRVEALEAAAGIDPTRVREN